MAVETVSENVSVDASAVLARVGHGRARGWRRALGPFVLLLLVIAALAAYFGLQKAKVKREAPAYVTVRASRGPLLATVAATGSVEGVGTVDVGAEISGMLSVVNVDFNDPVTRGQILCEIDPQQLKASRNQARAQLIAARADALSRQATANESQLQAERQRGMLKKGLVSDQQVEAAEAAAARASASVAAANAQITVAKAAVFSAQTALDKAKIRSPIDGVVLARNVEVGQAVAASFQTPVLFKLARDLSEMELTVAIDEADIGRVKTTQQASFTVDAYPTRTFPATLTAIRNVAVVIDNVVTYEARLSVDNGERLLRPGMTATVTVTTEKRDDALTVPNMALRFRPNVKKSRTMFGPPGGGPDSTTKQEDDALFVLKGEALVRIPVTLGLSDGTRTEVVAGAVEVDDEIVTDVLENKK